MNPYLSQLYAALERQGVPRGPDARLDLRFLLANRGTVRWLHAHWPESLYRWHRGPVRLRPALSWLKLGLFAVRLRVARLLGYRIVWTVHQVTPHETTQPALDRAGTRTLAAAADVLIAHDPETAAEATRSFDRRAPRVTVVAHGSYVGVYPPGRDRGTVRAELGIDPGDVVALCFGELRGDSDVDVLVDGLARVPPGRLRLVVAGNVKAGAAAEALERAEADERVRRLHGFVPLEGVAELFAAADVAVVPRGNGGTSGSLVLALSLGLPVVAADAPAYRELTAGGAAGWLFAPGDPDSLAAALTAAAQAPAEERRAKADAATAAAARLDWDEIARSIAALLR
jgi:glycosyltransferase involved in cell wall biosynthesis